MRPLRAPLALLLALALAGCGGGAKPQPGVQATLQSAAVTLTVRGVARIDFRTSTPLQFVVSDGKTIPANLRFLSIAMGHEESSPAGKFRAGINVFGFTGDGRFTIPAVGPGKPPAGLTTIAYLELTPPGGAADRFQRPVLPCSVELEKRGFKGSINCPALQDDKGKSITLVMSWTA